MTNQVVSGEITIKELYERVVAMETKLDEITKRGSRTEKRFVGYILVLGALILIDVVISVVFFFKYVL